MKATAKKFEKWVVDAYKAWLGGATTAQVWHKYAPDKTRSEVGKMLGQMCVANGTTFYTARANGAGGKAVAERTLVKHGVVTAPEKKARKRVKAAKKAEVAVAAMTAAEEEVLGGEL
jgi:hypothetical protein